MKFSHTEEDRDGRHLDVLTDEEDGLRIIVSRLGAELISMARINEVGEWIGFLYRDNDVTAPPEGWANHATVMGYYLHRLKNGSSLIAATKSRGYPRFSSRENMASRRIFYQRERRFAEIPNHTG